MFYIRYAVPSQETDHLKEAVKTVAPKLYRNEGFCLQKNSAMVMLFFTPDICICWTLKYYHKCVIFFIYIFLCPHIKGGGGHLDLPLSICPSEFIRVHRTHLWSIAIFFYSWKFVQIQIIYKEIKPKIKSLKVKLVFFRFNK